MAKQSPTAKEISKMSYETRRLRFNQEADDLFKRAVGMSTQELSAEYRKLVDRWKV